MAEKETNVTPLHYDKEALAHSPSDSEKGHERRPSAGDGSVPQNFREQDFMTRNGLNLKSFQRRELPPLLLPGES